MKKYQRHTKTEDILNRFPALRKRLESAERTPPVPGAPRVKERGRFQNIALFDRAKRSYGTHRDKEAQAPAAGWAICRERISARTRSPRLFK